MAAAISPSAFSGKSRFHRHLRHHERQGDGTICVQMTGSRSRCFCSQSVHLHLALDVSDPVGICGFWLSQLIQLMALLIFNDEAFRDAPMGA